MIPNSLRKAGSQEASLTAGRCKCEAATQQKGPSSPPASIASYSTQKRTCRPRLPRTAMTTLIWQETAGNVRRPAMIGGGAYYTLRLCVPLPSPGTWNSRQITTLPALLSAPMSGCQQPPAQFITVSDRSPVLLCLASGTQCAGCVVFSPSYPCRSSTALPTHHAFDR
jgi:hypothetical protein